MKGGIWAGNICAESNKVNTEINTSQNLVIHIIIANVTTQRHACSEYRS